MSSFRPYWTSRPADPDTQPEPLGYSDNFNLDLPIADPADLPAATLDPEQIRTLRDRADPLTAHRTRRNQR